MTALLYACIGFGGGSTYNALMVLGGTDYQLIPIISLICNIVVVSGGAWHFSRHNHIKIKLVLPWIIFSIPAAWVGGYIAIPEVVFIGILGGALFLSGVKMLRQEKEIYPIKVQHHQTLAKSAVIPPVVGASLGFLAGITGIGGGIFLAPVLHLLRWSDPKNIAGTCSIFILVNSLSGLIGQSVKLGSTGLLTSTVDAYWYLFPAVLAGGQIGSWLGSCRINVGAVKKLTAILILYVSISLLWRFLKLLTLI